MKQQQQQQQEALNKILGGDVEQFLTAVYGALEEAHIISSSSAYQCDHLCFRVETEEEYQEKKRDLYTVAELLHEDIIGGRLIATFKLQEPIVYGPWTIPCVELPSPKPGSFYPTGLEHIELVISESFESFMQRHSHLNFDKRAMGKAINPDIQLLFPPYTVKFHHQPLEQVIAYEKALAAQEQEQQ